MVIPNQRQINRENNAEQLAQRKLQSKRKRDEVMAQIRQAKLHLDKALHQVTVKARVEAVYNVEKGEKMVSTND